MDGRGRIGLAVVGGPRRESGVFVVGVERRGEVETKNGMRLVVRVLRMSSVRWRVNWLQRASGLFERKEVSARKLVQTARVAYRVRTARVRGLRGNRRERETSERVRWSSLRAAGCEWSGFACV